MYGNLDIISKIIVIYIYILYMIGIPVIRYLVLVSWCLLGSSSIQAWQSIIFLSLCMKSYESGTSSSTGADCHFETNLNENYVFLASLFSLWNMLKGFNILIFFIICFQSCRWYHCTGFWQPLLVLCTQRSCWESGICSSMRAL